jgi:hypothetical protein
MNRFTTEMYESMLRDQLAVNRVKMLVISSVDVTDADLAGAQPDPAKAAMVKQMILYNKRNAALKSFVDGAKAKIEVKINKEIIS